MFYHILLGSCKNGSAVLYLCGGDHRPASQAAVDRHATDGDRGKGELSASMASYCSLEGQVLLCGMYIYLWFLLVCMTAALADFTLIVYTMLAPNPKRSACLSSQVLK